MLQGLFEYAWGNFSFSQSSKIKISQVQSSSNFVIIRYTENNDMTKLFMKQLPKKTVR